jgi:hypothetical protein
MVPAGAGWFGLVDLYKALHQSYCGPGHAIPNPEAAATRLQDEWRGLQSAAPGEILIESLRPRSLFVRVHLRPYRDSGGSMPGLLEAFLRSAGTPIDPTGFTAAWRATGSLVERGRLPFAGSEFAALDERLLAAGYPAIHHSDDFERVLCPAYRLVDPVEADRLRGILPHPPLE